MFWLSLFSAGKRPEKGCLVSNVKYFGHILTYPAGTGAIKMVLSIYLSYKLRNVNAISIFKEKRAVS